MTELYRFTIEEVCDGRETTHELYVKANDLTTATDAAIEYTSTFYPDAVQSTDEDGSLSWETSLGEMHWEIGSIAPIECIAITPVNAPAIYIPLPIPIVAAD